MNILSIDYGERYLGLAVYVTKSKTKFALKIVDTKKSESYRGFKKCSKRIFDI